MESSILLIWLAVSASAARGQSISVPEKQVRYETLRGICCESIMLVVGGRKDQGECVFVVR